MPRVLSVLDTLYCTLGQQHRADAVKLAALEAAPQDLQLVQAVFESYVRWAGCLADHASRLAGRPWNMPHGLGSNRSGSAASSRSVVGHASVA